MQRQEGTVELSAPENSCSKSETSIPEEIQLLFVEFRAVLQSWCHLCPLPKPAPAFPFHGKPQDQQQPAHTWRGIQSSRLFLWLQRNLCEGKSFQNEEINRCKAQRKAACSRLLRCALPRCTLRAGEQSWARCLEITWGNREAAAEEGKDIKSTASCFDARIIRKAEEIGWKAAQSLSVTGCCCTRAERRGRG